VISGMIDDVGGPIDYDDCGAGPTVVLQAPRIS